MFYNIKEKLEYITVCTLIYASKVMPKSFIYKFFDISSILFYKFGKRRSRLTIKNLKLAFAKKSNDEINELALAAYKSIGITIGEILMMFNGRVDIDSMIENKEEILKKLKEWTKDSKNGVIFITAHFSNWEIMAQFLALHGFKMVIIGREGNNKLIEKNITTPFRENCGNMNVYKKSAMIKLVKTLKKNGYAGLLIDQKAGKNESVKVKFFGKDADTANSVAILKLKLDPIVIPIFIPRMKNGKYKIVAYEPVEYKDSSDNKEEKIVKMTQKYNDIMEDIIKKYPEQWFWMHNRWRLS